MVIIIILIIFLLGLALGSFLNVVILRLKSGESPWWGRSRCVRCQHYLAALDLIPLASFLILRGRCRYCRKPISWQYPAMELATGILLISFYCYWGFSVDFLFYAAYALILLIIFVCDLRFYLILDKVLIVGLVLAVLGSFFLTDLAPWQGLIGSFTAGGFFWLLFALTGGRGLGGGDVKMGFLIGFMLGWPNILVGLFLAFISGAVIGAILMLLGRKKMKDHLPFGAFLAGATVLAFFIAPALVFWYGELLRF